MYVYIYIVYYMLCLLRNFYWNIYEKNKMIYLHTKFKQNLIEKKLCSSPSKYELYLPW